MMKFLQSNLSLKYEEFTVNLENYKQEKMENQEGDLFMIKALISINPEAASIQPYTQTEECESVTNKVPSE